MTTSEMYVETVRAAPAEAGFVDLAERVCDDLDEDDDDDAVPAIHGASTPAELDAVAKACNVAYAAVFRR